MKETDVRVQLAALAIVFAGASLYAHVTVMPRESRPGVEQRYVVRVPTEGQVATTVVELEIPAGVMVTEVIRGEGYTFDLRRMGDRIVAITWKREIPPKQTAEFAFVARNPQAAEVAWKARQRFADGTSADWIGVEGDRRPASVTRLTPGP
jgi:uncharacterized protein YcnI